MSSVRLRSLRVLGRLAQSVERVAVNREVVGSNPTLAVFYLDLPDKKWSDKRWKVLLLAY
jgi:hypothetical protein